MNSLVVYLFGSGLAFFVGAGLLLLASAVGTDCKHLFSRSATFAACIGIVLIVLSAAPLPWWYYALALLLTVNWLFISNRSNAVARTYQIAARVAAGGIWIVGIGMELPYQFTPHVVPAARQIDLFGDSISAGIGGSDENTWPNVLARDHRIEIVNHAAPGATVADMLRCAKSVNLADGLVLLEIGGNDLLGTTALADFERDLEALLTHVCDNDRQVLMFELPLPPTYNRFGEVQRRLAHKHHVKLIPKRLFMGVLTDGGATLDSLHLSRAGHQQMATVVWSVIQPAFPH